MQSENYLFLIDSQLLHGWILVWGSSQELYVFSYSLQLRGRQPDALQHNWMRNFEMERFKLK